MFNPLICLTSLSLLLSACALSPNSLPSTRTNRLSQQSTANSFSLLQANIGNVDPVCSLQARSKLCHQDVEDRIAARIRQLRPDLVSLQEVLPDWICRKGKAANRGQVCQNYQTRPVRDQVRRLLGTDYTIVCEPKQSWDCIGLRKEIGRILPDPQGKQCPPGGLCGTERLSGGDLQAQNRDQAYTPYYALTIDSGLDPGFHMMQLDLELKGQKLRLINGHPQSGHKQSEQAARAAQLQEAFKLWANQPRVLITGDLNMDPFRQSDLSVQVWNSQVDNYSPKGQLLAEKIFHYHSGPVEQPPVWPPRLSASYLWPLPSLTLDHVVSNFAGGTCRTLEQAEDLSGGKGTDHRGIWCKLGW